MIGYPKPAPAPPKAPKPLRRKTWLRSVPDLSAKKRKSRIPRNLNPLKRTGRPDRRKQRIRKCVWDHPQVKAQSRRALRRDRHRCRLQHPGCTLRATQTHHTKYSPGRGWRRLILDDLKWLISVCFNCHKVEDPWLGTGPGKGSRKANGLAEQPRPATEFVERA